MNTTRLSIPVNSLEYEVDILFLSQGIGTKQAGPLWYLHEVRSDAGKEISTIMPERSDWLSEAYNNELKSYKRKFELLLYNHKFELILSAPSSRDDIRPYIEAAHNAHGHVELHTECFRKRSGCKAGTAESLDEFLPCVELCCEVDFGKYNHILIVDESLSQGFTAAAMIRRMRDRGLKKTCRITLAVALYVKQLS